MHGSASLAGRWLLVVLLVVGVSTPVMADPTHPDPSPTNPAEGPPSPPHDFELTPLNPIPVPEGEPDDYLDRDVQGAVSGPFGLAVVVEWLVTLVN